jgi:predicted ribosomally synthesized peptide with SipW-like signal peptide
MKEQMMKAILKLTVALGVLLFATSSYAWFNDDDWDDWGGGNWNPYDEWDPRYWMEEMENEWDDDDDYYRRGPYGYGGPYGGYGPYGPGYGYGGYGPGYGGYGGYAPYGYAPYGGGYAPPAQQYAPQQAPQQYAPQTQPQAAPGQY